MTDETIEVVLDRGHYHHDEWCDPQTTIHVTPAQAQWLERDGIAHRAPARSKSRRSTADKRGAGDEYGGDER